MSSNPARPSSGALLARLSQVSDNSATAFDFVAHEARYSLILVRRGDSVKAYENRCPHAGFPLERPDGRVAMHGGFMVCSAHGASFDAETGACVGGPGMGRALIPVAIVIANGEIRMA